ncbi:MAG: WGR domain-containing protein [Oscillospiraceae bacterium]
MSNYIFQNPYLQWTSPIGNHNKFYEITENDDGSIDVNYGRVGQKGVSKHYCGKTFYGLKSEKIAKGYQDLTSLHSQLTPTQDSRMMDELSYQKTDDECI